MKNTDKGDGNMNFYTFINQSEEKLRKLQTQAIIPKLYKENDILDENKSVKWNREEVLRRNEKMNEEKRRHQELVCQELKKIESFIKDKIMNFGFTEEQTEKIFQKAYENAHSNGYREVYEEAMDLSDFIKSF